MSSNPPRPSSVEIVAANTPELFAEAVRRAAALLRRGEVVALPTETVYGLAADAFNPEAVARVFAVKGRPAENPVIVHVASGEMARRCAAHWPEAAHQLAAAFWPGPLTLVVDRSKAIPGIVTAGGPTVGLRWPAHPLMQAVIRACGFPLAAPSANLANTVSPTDAAHVMSSLGGRIPMVVDGGPSQVGIESTVVDVTVRPVRILRPGMIHEESLAAALGEAVVGAAGGGAEGVLRSPGRLPRHYCPKARLVVSAWDDEADLAGQLRELTDDWTLVQVLAFDRIPAGLAVGRVCVIPHEPEAYARAMYAEWHRCDASGARWIVVERVPDSPAWRAIADRLARASAGSLREGEA